jgi:hypothetical protein
MSVYQNIGGIGIYLWVSHVMVVAFMVGRMIL